MSAEDSLRSCPVLNVTTVGPRRFHLSEDQAYSQPRLFSSRGGAELSHRASQTTNVPSVLTPSTPLTTMTIDVCSVKVYPKKQGAIRCDLCCPNFNISGVSRDHDDGHRPHLTHRWTMLGETASMQAVITDDLEIRMKAIITFRITDS